MGIIIGAGPRAGSAFYRATLLETRRLSKSFGSLKAVDEVDLCVADGDAIGIIGPNGAGKSTLFNLIAGNLDADSGLVMLEGRDITMLKTHRRCQAGIGRTYQIPQPFEHMTVFENLLVAATHGRKMPARAASDFCAKILERTKLLRYANTAAGALTESECHELVATIRSIHDEGVTIVWIEHIVHALLAVVDRLIVLNFGRKIAEGQPRAVMSSAEVREIYLGLAA